VIRNRNANAKIRIVGSFARSSWRDRDEAIESIASESRRSGPRGFRFVGGSALSGVWSHPNADRCFQRMGPTRVREERALLIFVPLWTREFPKTPERRFQSRKRRSR